MINTTSAAAVGKTTESGDDVGDKELESFVGSGVGSDNAVAVELGGCKQADGVNGLGEGYLTGLGLAEAGEDTTGGGKDGLALGCRGVEGG